MGKGVESSLSSSQKNTNFHCLLFWGEDRGGLSQHGAHSTTALGESAACVHGALLAHAQKHRLVQKKNQARTFLVILGRVIVV
jgi:hypothetical protein